MEIENWKLKITTKYKALTLVELLIVIAFITIMTSAAMVSFRTSKDKKSVETEARKVAASIREAQNDAVTGKKGSSGMNPCNFRWKTIDSATYRIRLWNDCSAYPTEVAANADNVSYSLQNGVVFLGVTATAAEMLDFSVPWGNFSDRSADVANGGVGVADNTVTLKKGSCSVSILVNAAGNVTEGAVVGC